MSRPLRIEPTFTAEEAERVIRALEASQEHEIAKKVRRTYEIDKRSWEADEAARIAEAELRASRAANHTLTIRQAECLAAVRAGQGPYHQPYFYAGSDKCHWRRARSMGGAVNRMVETLIEEGLLDDRRKLTEGGRVRLEAYEAKHGRIGGA
ncbi:hypothetical protein [Mesorhizobium sp. M2A.F.Ca.ET.039.01.1.1]|uniref:hypothetical protein n=1 Tax=Mesorhizobium sp. M2A.F.Ca.ET.039.01.1.1 TaxID=2496746 RepID=UPI000FCA7855|nr:hypothetical protein [Mesorhizobium sp. M2A.F.Ca.ET.039.01.1.1]RWX72562.1 hypothetical protein EOA24_00800 [Mesorhizobium sp. M2A.F.Ca.ET.039.01.1.1]